MMQRFGAIPFPNTKRSKFSEMELSSSNIKKIILFSQKKYFLIFPRNGTMHFSAQALKRKELHLGKIYYPSGNEDPLPPPKKKNPYISGNAISKKASYISEHNFQCQNKQKQTKKSALKNFLVSYDVFAVFTSQ